MKPFGLTSGREQTAQPSPCIGILPVIKQSTNHAVLGLNDRHLDCRVLIEIEGRGAAWQEISVSTSIPGMA